jgi:hypothetical protein
MRAALIAATLVACSSGEPARRDLEPAASPAGKKADVLDNPLHRAHLGGTTPLGCEACHELAKEFVAPDRDRCLTCHPARATAIHGEAIACGECHGFDASSEREAINCRRCHAEPQGDARAINAHARVDCQSCHRPHGQPALDVTDCLTCHEDHERDHGKRGQTTIQRCSDCHPPHTKSIEAVARCATCHKDRIRNLRGHDRCEVCHQGDRTSAPKQLRGCTDCHKANAALASAKVADHRKCETCHSPHDPLGTARQSCRRCHGEVKPAHPGDKKLGSCLGCHPAHPKSGASVAACATCHRAAGNDAGFHAAGKTRCADCHKSHGFAAPSCASCHQPIRAQVNRGHQKCADCHREPHRASAPPAACATCHQAQHASAPAGHKKCSACHQSHSGARVRGSDCAACHAEKTRAMHGQIAGGCTSCHRAHGPGGRARPPACATCHQRSGLPGLHAVAEHGRCATCHLSHEKKVLDRQTCLGSCHLNMTDHEPVAKTCVGCHPFGGTRRR